jgi:hypothetical protein
MQLLWHRHRQGGMGADPMLLAFSRPDAVTYKSTSRWFLASWTLRIVLFLYLKQRFGDWTRLRLQGTDAESSLRLQGTDAESSLRLQGAEAEFSLRLQGAEAESSFRLQGTDAESSLRLRGRTQSPVSVLGGRKQSPVSVVSQEPRSPVGVVPGTLQWKSLFPQLNT